MSIIETGIYKTDTNNPNKLIYAGQKTAWEVFNELKVHLERSGYLPDEYFSIIRFENGELFPEDAEILCSVNWGNNEGIYLDITLRTRNERNELQYQGFARGKTLMDSEDALDRMYMIAAACTKAFHSPGVHNRFIIAKETTDTNEFVDLFDSLALEKQFRPTLHIDWEDMGDSITEILSGVFNRDIKAVANRSEYYYWSVGIYDTPLTEAETEKLNELFGADEYDRGIQAEEEFPMTEICQDLANKMLSKLVPFPVTKSFADDEGIWVLGEVMGTGALKDL